ncbi:MAG TPA: diadenylate cyclase [Candidatus Binatia bacterium]|nr:diadenylate cyclase [Candidatus Binatia bacterium]
MNDENILNPFISISLAEVVDILVVAILLYTAIVWAQRTRAIFVVRGILVLGGIFLFARYLGLEMTAWVFQGFFAVLVIVIVVIFQEELRRMFERIAVWSVIGRRVPALHSTSIDTVVRTVSDLARDHIGALVVIRGKDPIERHITGGIPLNGILSETLLKSIFDPHSPGHDGAVLVENNHVIRFAVQLPLSKDTPQLAHVGTRHSAALGMAELSDAICVVVSQERGTVSIARDGKLQKLDNIQELTAALQRFLEEKFPTYRQRALSLQLVRENWLIKIAALSLAIGFWYIFVPGSKLVEMTYNIPVAVENLPADLKLDQIQPTEVTIRFSGPRRAFYLFDRNKLRVTVDASLAVLGRRTFELSEQNLRHPKDITLVSLDPPTVRIAVVKVPKEIPPEKIE